MASNKGTNRRSVVQPTIERISKRYHLVSAAVLSSFEEMCIRLKEVHDRGDKEELWASSIGFRNYCNSLSCLQKFTSFELMFTREKRFHKKCLKGLERLQCKRDKEQASEAEQFFWSTLVVQHGATIRFNDGDAGYIDQTCIGGPWMETSNFGFITNFGRFINHCALSGKLFDNWVPKCLKSELIGDKYVDELLDKRVKVFLKLIQSKKLIRGITGGYTKEIEELIKAGNELRDDDDVISYMGDDVHSNYSISDVELELDELPNQDTEVDRNQGTEVDRKEVEDRVRQELQGVDLLTSTTVCDLMQTDDAVVPPAATKTSKRKKKQGRADADGDNSNSNGLIVAGERAKFQKKKRKEHSNDRFVCPRQGCGYYSWINNAHVGFLKYKDGDANGVREVDITARYTAKERHNFVALSSYKMMQVHTKMCMKEDRPVFFRSRYIANQQIDCFCCFFPGHLNTTLQTLSTESRVYFKKR
jgi:hypothetical protein